MGEIEQRLAELEHAGLSRRLRLVAGAQGPHVLLDGDPVLLLCSNNYLGLADHQRVRDAAARTALEVGTGAGASRLVSGTMTIHAELERRLAEFEGSEACVLFGSGYLANLGTIGALAGPGDTIFSDALNHASIVDGCRASRAEVVVYRHLDCEHLEQCLERDGAHEGKRQARRDRAHSGDDHSEEKRRRVIVTDSVFSMDGDVAPLARIVELARRYDVRLIVDEAHATGALGAGGRGAVAAAGLQGEVDVIVGTLGKALGSYGAYVCASEQMVRYLVNVSRPLIFSTAPAPPSVAGALAALDLLESQPELVDRLHEVARALRAALAGEGFAVQESDMHIVPLLIGDSVDAMRMCDAALQRGVFAQAIRPPTIPRGTSRLRLATMASHTAAECREAAKTLAASARSVGLDPTTIGEHAAGMPRLAGVS